MLLRAEETVNLLIALINYELRESLTHIPL